MTELQPEAPEQEEPRRPHRYSFWPWGCAVVAAVTLVASWAAWFGAVKVLSEVVGALFGLCDPDSF